MRGLITVAMLGVLAACGESAPSLPVAKALAAEGANHSGASWSPDGKRIAWWQPVADSGTGFQLWIANADFSSPATLPVIGVNSPVTWSPDGTRLAATSTQFGAPDVVVVPLLGGPVRRMTSGGGVHFHGNWNKDGDRLEVTETAEGGTFRTSVVSLSTGKTSLLVPSEKLPFIGAWSPDGSHVAYFQIKGPKTTLWVADSAGGHPRQLSTEGFETFGASPWSPDGKELLYESRRTGTSDLWVAPIDGGKPRQLTRDVRNDYNGAWSSDGKWVAFTSDRGRQVDVWVVPSAGGLERRVTDAAAEENEPPRFRPGTQELTFVSQTRKSGVWAVDVADGKERRLTPDSLRTGFFSVSPDGKQFDFVIERGGSIQDLAVMPIVGGAFRTLLAGGGTVFTPYWSPDGSKIAFASDRAGNIDIFVLDASGGAPRQVEKWPGYEQDATWSGDGTWLYFMSDREAKLADVWKVPAAGGEPARVTHDGSVNGIESRRGVPDLFISSIGQRKGEFRTSRLAADGSLQVIWEKTNSFPQAISPRGDSLVVMVDQPNGKTQAMMFPTHGGQGRILLPSSERPGNWSDDGKSMIYSYRLGGTDHLGVLTLADGSKRRLTTSPDNDAGAEWTPDGKTIVFRRVKNVSRIFTSDLTKLLAGAKH